MPRVPTYDQFQASPIAIPGDRFNPPQAIDTAGRQAQEMGQGMQMAGQGLSDIAKDEILEANRVKLVAAQNAAMTAKNNLKYGDDAGAPGFLGLKGDAALTRPDGQALPDEYGQKLRQALTDISGTLGNDAQKRAFAMWSGTFHAEFQGEVQAHMASELQQFKLSTYDGAAKLALDDAQRNWNDLEKVRNAIDGTPDPLAPDQRYGGLKFSAYQFGKAKGWAPPEIDAFVKAQTSGAHAGVVISALQNNNPTYASQYLQQNKDSMTASDLLRTQGMVTKEVVGQKAQAAVTASTQYFASRFMPTDLDRLKGIVTGLESGGKDTNADGTPLTSPKGAMYRMQVMPETAKNPGFGITPAKDDSPAEYNRVGEQYLAALVQKYNNPAFALAAYNAGPGALDAAVAKAKAAGTPDTWLTLLPKETQGYVVNGMKKFQSGQGASPPPTEMEFVQESVARLGPNATPEEVTAGRTTAEHQFAIISRSVREQGDQAVSQVQQALQTNGGDINAIAPVLRNKVPPGKWDDLIKYAKVIGNPDRPTNRDLYMSLATYPTEMAKMPDAQFMMLRSQLSDSDFKHFADERAAYINGTKVDTADVLNSKFLNETLKNRVSQMGVAIPTKESPRRDREWYGAVQQFVRDSVFDQQKEIGRKMTPAEISERVDKLFAQNIDFRTAYLGGLFSTSTPQNMLSMHLADIPEESIDQIRQALARRGNKMPSADLILRTYWTHKSRGNGAMPVVTGSGGNAPELEDAPPQQEGYFSGDHPVANFIAGAVGLGQREGRYDNPE